MPPRPALDPSYFQTIKALPNFLHTFGTSFSTCISCNSALLEPNVPSSLSVISRKVLKEICVKSIYPFKTDDLDPEDASYPFCKYCTETVSKLLKLYRELQPVLEEFNEARNQVAQCVIKAFVQANRDEEWEEDGVFNYWKTTAGHAYPTDTLEHGTDTECEIETTATLENCDDDVVDLDRVKSEDLENNEHDSSWWDRVSKGDAAIVFDGVPVPIDDNVLIPEDVIKSELLSNPEESNSVDPDLEESNSADPGPEESNSVDPDPEESNSVDPDPKESNIVDPNPEESNSVDPNPEESNSVDPDPKESNIVDPEPDESNSVDPPLPESFESNKHPEEFSENWPPDDCVQNRCDAVMTMRVGRCRERGSSRITRGPKKGTKYTTPKSSEVTETRKRLKRKCVKEFRSRSPKRKPKVSKKVAEARARPTAEVSDAEIIQAEPFSYNEKEKPRTSDTPQSNKQIADTDMEFSTQKLEYLEKVCIPKTDPVGVKKLTKMKQQPNEQPKKVGRPKKLMTTDTEATINPQLLGDRKDKKVPKVREQRVAVKVKTEQNSNGEIRKKKPAKCSICGKIICSTYNLKLHMRCHTGEKPYKCTLCEMSFSKPPNLTTHMLRHTQQKMFICDLCGAKFSYKSVMRTHKASQHNIFETETVVECEFCLKKFLTNGEKNKHRRKSHCTELKNQFRNISCSFCKISFDKNDDLEAHRITEQHKTAVVIVERSKTVVKVQIETSENEMDVDKPVNEIHDVQLRIQCGECELKLPNTELMKMHERKVHRKLDFECEVCGKGFVNKKYFEKHILSHVNEKPFIYCEYCGVGFHKTRFHLKHLCTVHPELHLKDSPSVCKCCFMTFTSEDELFEHVKSHNDSKCQYCGKMFEYIYLLKQHLSTHTLEKQYNCNQCDKSCSDESSLKEHLSSHIGSYPCSQCDHAFSEEKMLQNHIKKEHSTALPEAESQPLPVNSSSLINAADNSSNTEADSKVSETCQLDVSMPPLHLDSTSVSSPMIDFSPWIM